MLVVIYGQELKNEGDAGTGFLEHLNLLRVLRKAFEVHSYSHRSLGVSFAKEVACLIPTGDGLSLTLMARFVADSLKVEAVPYTLPSSRNEEEIAQGNDFFHRMLLRLSGHYDDIIFITSGEYANSFSSYIIEYHAMPGPTEMLLPGQGFIIDAEKWTYMSLGPY